MNASLGRTSPNKLTVPSNRSRSQRRGVAAVLITTMLFVFVILAAITIDFSYMQLVQTEMRAATDAAAKAGAEALARTEDTNLAKQEAVRYAAANRVGGQAFQLSVNDVKIGRIFSQGNGRWGFTENATPPNAVRVDARTGGSAAHGAIPLHFSNVLGRSSFSPHYAATAGQQEVEVCLCLDRSGSMLFDMSGTDYSYPRPNPRLSSFTAWGETWRYHLSPPHPTLSRWAILRDSINLFLNEAGNYNPKPRTALVTWGSNYTMPIAPSTVFPQASTDYNLPVSGSHDWNANVTAIQNSIASRGNVPMMGGTNLSAGLDRAVSILRGPNSSSFTNKVVILFTDGQWNEGRSPILAANDAQAQGITVHCVSMLTGHQPDLQSIADITGGRYIRTSSTAELRQAFIDLANSLPVVLTE